MITLAESAQELFFNANSLLLTLIHFGFNAVQAGSFATATQVDGDSALTVKVQIALGTL